MNERLKELYRQAHSVRHYDNDPSLAGNPPTVYWQGEVSAQQFAELIVRECAGLCSQAAEENARTFYTVSETKEVGPALVAKGSQVQAEKLAKHIKQHFGVKE